MFDKYKSILDKNSIRVIPICYKKIKKIKLFDIINTNPKNVCNFDFIYGDIVAICNWNQS